MCGCVCVCERIYAKWREYVPTNKSHAECFASKMFIRRVHCTLVALFPSLPHFLIAFIFAHSNAFGSRGKDTHFDGGWFAHSEKFSLTQMTRLRRNINRFAAAKLKSGCILHLASLTFWHRTENGIQFHFNCNTFIW